MTVTPAPERTTGRPQDRAPQGLRTASSVAGRLLVVLAAVVVVTLVVLQLRLVVIPLVLGAAIAALLHRQVAWLARHRLPRSAAALLVTLGWTLALGAALVLVGVTIAGEVDELSASVTAGIDELRDYVARFGVDEQQLSELQASVTSAVQENRQSLTTGLLTGATVLFEIVAGFFLFVVVLFFFLRDGSSIWGWVLARVPHARRDTTDRSGRAALSSLAGYLRGTAIIAAVDATLIGLALLLLGVPLVVPLAVLVFLGAFIPVVGSALAGSVAVLVALVAEGPVTAALALAAVVVVQQVEGDVLAPIVFGRTLSLHPLVIVVALTGGAVVGGILGAAASVPLVAAAWAVIRVVRPSVSDEPPVVVDEGSTV